MTDSGRNSSPETRRPENPAHISIKVKDQNENEVFFKIKRTTKLSKVFDAYCDRHSIQGKHVRFLLDGSRVQNEDTPGGLEMEEGDMLEVVLEQLGGEASLDLSSYNIISIRDSNKGAIFFKLRRNMNLSKAFVKFSNFYFISRELLKFFFKGRLVQDDDSLKSIKMLDGDVLDAIKTPIFPSGTTQPVEGRHDRITIKVEGSTGETTFFLVKNMWEKMMPPSACNWKTAK